MCWYLDFIFDGRVGLLFVVLRHLWLKGSDHRASGRICVSFNMSFRRPFKYQWRSRKMEEAEFSAYRKQLCALDVIPQPIFSCTSCLFCSKSSH